MTKSKCGIDYPDPMVPDAALYMAMQEGCLNTDYQHEAWGGYYSLNAPEVARAMMETTGWDDAYRSAAPIMQESMGLRVLDDLLAEF